MRNVAAEVANFIWSNPLVQMLIEVVTAFVVS